MKKITILVLCFVFAFSLTTIAWEATHDFEGRTVTFDWRDEAIYVEHFAEGAEKAYLEEIEEKFNVNIEFAHTWGPDKIVSDIMAGDASDVFLLSRMFWENLALEDAFMNLNDVLTKDYWERVPATHRNSKEFYQVGGDYYSFVGCGDPEPETDLNVFVLYWNKTLFEKENLPNLYELQANKEWTWDALKNITEKVVKDTSGDGETDQWGFSSAWPLSKYAMTAALYSNNAARTKLEDGQRKFALNDPEAIEAIQFIRDLNTEYEAVPPPIDGKGQTGLRTEGALEHFINGDLAMFLGANFNGGTLLEEMEDDFGVVFFPLGPNGDDYVAPAFTTSLLIPVTTDEDPEALVELASAVHQAIAPYQNIEEHEQTVLEENYFQIVSDRESLAVYEQVMQGNWRFPYFENVIQEQWKWPVINPIMIGNKPVSATLNEVAPEMQAIYDEAVNEK